ncbi:hypothetical protein M9Y10_010388 [Tritrichomonas musculus]|uniref:Glycosyl hydrolase family 13 catalytic domain-containing protein n=1 Tax=Tritrichomonas musculus TaxID=1915356 RepID=A0ABR2IKK1_9EUKA
MINEEEEEEEAIEIIKNILKMVIDTMNTISYQISQPINIKDISQIQIIDSENMPIKIKSISSLNLLTDMGTIKLQEDIDLTKSYTVSIDDYGTKKAIPREVFDSEYFIKNFTYDGNDLGATVSKDGTTFKVWAPTAKSVLLNLFNAGNGCEPFLTVTMDKEPFGIWSHSEKGVGHGIYYTYTVTTSNGMQEAVDPYSKSAGLNGLRGMVVDHCQARPKDFEKETYIDLDSYRQAIIWETHVRDFSNNIEKSRYKGKYLSFTETGMKNSNGIPIGIDYVKDLGITHIHLMPVFDFKSVDESKGDQFNWGYDPQNYNVPEGSYSTIPEDGSNRIIEFKRMIQALHCQGLGVVMDVVYNHTYDTNSNLNKIVPFYYYRYNDDGTNSNGSGCGNDTASERLMFRKYIIDSVLYWMETYKIDGFRFDLMGLIDLETMSEIEKKIHSVNKSALIYGEAWMMGTATHVPLANQANIKQIVGSGHSAGTIAVFNDAFRDGIRGNVFDHEKPGYLGNPTDEKSIEKVIFGLEGGVKKNEHVSWSVSNASVINYISVHDNNTLFDKLKISCPESNDAEIIKMNRMGAALVMLSNGTVLMQSGEEILRSKVNPDGSYNDNSYNSSDDVNNIKWQNLSPNCVQYQTFLFYKGLIDMRKKIKVLTSETEKVEVKVDGECLIAEFDDGLNEKVVAVVNPTDDDFICSLPEGKWSLIANEVQAGATEIACECGEITVSSKSVNVYLEKKRIMC